MAKLAKHRRKPGQVASRKDAIRNFCMECMGYQMAEIRRCTSTECWLYPWRLGMLDDEVKKEKKKAKAKKTEKEAFKFKE